MTDSNNNTSPQQPVKKSAPIGMIAISIILAGALIFLVFMYFSQKNTMIEMETVLTNEKDSLANELRLMVNAYDTLKTNNDSLNAGLEKERTRIVQLLVNKCIKCPAHKKIQKRDNNNERNNEELHCSDRLT